jgi:hypothetical protein
VVVGPVTSGSAPMRPDSFHNNTGKFNFNIGYQF